LFQDKALSVIFEIDAVDEYRRCARRAVYIGAQPSV